MPIIGKIEIIKHTTKAAVILHNFLTKIKGRGTYCPPDYIDQETLHRTLLGRWQVEANGVQGLIELGIEGLSIFAITTKEVRNDFKDFFNSPTRRSELAKPCCSKYVKTIRWGLFNWEFYNIIFVKPNAKGKEPLKKILVKVLRFVK